MRQIFFNFYSAPHVVSLFTLPKISMSFTGHTPARLLENQVQRSRAGMLFRRVQNSESFTLLTELDVSLPGHQSANALIPQHQLGGLAGEYPSYDPA